MMCIVPLHQVIFHWILLLLSQLNPQHVTVNMLNHNFRSSGYYFAFIWRPVLDFLTMSFWSELYALSEYLSYNVHILIFILPAMWQCWHSLSWHVETILFLTVLTKTYGLVEAMVSMLSHTVTQCDKLDIGSVCELYWIIDIMYIYINDEGIASQPSDSPTRWQPTRRQVTRRL